MNHDDIDRFRRVISGRIGLHFEDARLGFLGELLRRRLESCQDSAEHYLARLEGTGELSEISELARELTVGETYFFRNIDQFHALAQAALPDRISVQRAVKTLRILSAGCASGEEAYSIAMVVHEVLPDRAWDVTIQAVDVNPAAIERASGARYAEWALRETPPHILRKWFRPDGREFALNERIRTTVEFEERNLAADDPNLWRPDEYDIVFCRNVVMYLTSQAAQDVVTRIMRSLKPGGYLFLGHAETLRGFVQDFQLRHTHNTFYYQRKDSLAAHAGVTGFTSARPGAVVPVLATCVEGADSWIEAIRGASERVRALAGHAAGTSSFEKTPYRPRDLVGAMELLQKEQFSDALEIVHGLPPGSDDDPDVLLVHAALLIHSGQIAAAESTCRKLLQHDDLNAGAHYLLALCREGAGDPGGAADEDQAATYLDPAFAMPRFHLGLLARHSGDRDAARCEFQQALALLQREDAARLMLFGGGFGREALIGLCAAELVACGGKL